MTFSEIHHVAKLRDDGEFLPATDDLTVSGDQGKLSIGDFKTTITHVALARDKNMVMLTFAHGAPARAISA